MLDLDPPRAERGHIAVPAVPWAGVPGLAHALAACRTRDSEGVWHGLAQLARRVPKTHVAAVSRLSDRREVLSISCPCGAAQMVEAGFTECSGGCGRWFAAGATDAWAFRLPPQEQGE